MNLDNNEQRQMNAISLRLAARLRQIADSQRAPQHVRDRVFAGIAGEQFAERRRGIRWDLVAAATGGAFLSAAAAMILWVSVPTMPPAQQQVESWLDIALNQVTGAGVMETAQPASLESWFASQVDYAVDVPNIPDASLRGGRVAYLAGVQGVAVEYEIEGKDLTYLMVPEGNVLDMLLEQGDTLVTWSSRGYQIVMWRQGGGTRALVGSLPKQEINEIADHCRRTMI
jgi:anti-sigma factor RsiW